MSGKWKGQINNATAYCYLCCCCYGDSCDEVHVYDGTHLKRMRHERSNWTRPIERLLAGWNALIINSISPFV